MASLRAILLTSIDVNEITQKFSPEQKKEYRALLGENSSYLEMISQSFTKTFDKLGYESKIIHSADQDDLFQALNSQDYSAVFWVSHASSPDLILKSSVKISNIFCFDVAPVFGSIGPKVAVLAVISCYSLYMTDEVFSLKPHLMPPKVIAFPFPVDVKKGLDFALAETQSFIQNGSITSRSFIASSEECDELQVDRICETDLEAESFFPALRVFSNDGQILTTLPRCLRGERYSKKICVRGNLQSLLVSAGLPDGWVKNFDLGYLRIHSEEQEWSVFRKKRTGKPYGFHNRIFHRQKR